MAKKTEGETIEFPPEIQALMPKGDKTFIELEAEEKQKIQKIALMAFTIVSGAILGGWVYNTLILPK